MTIAATYLQSVGTALLIDSSGASAGTVTLTSLANGSYRQTTKVDFGTNWSSIWLVELEIELAATPTNGLYLDLWANPSSSSTAGTDNKGNCSGADAAYTGYSSNPADATQHLVPVGTFRCTAQATGTVQKGVIRERWCPPARYCSFVLLNATGVAVHSSAANCLIRFTPMPPVAVT